MKFFSHLMYQNNFPIETWGDPRKLDQDRANGKLPVSNCNYLLALTGILVHLLYFCSFFGNKFLKFLKYFYQNNS